MPGRALSPTGAGAELESHVCDLRTPGHEFLQAFPISLGARIQVEGGGQAFAKELLMDQSNSYNAMQVIPPRLVDKQAVVGTCHESDAKPAQRSNALAPMRAERPPALKRGVAVRACENDRHI